MQLRVLPAFVLLMLAHIAPAQVTDQVQWLLPAGAEIIETADLTAVVAKPRLMVLWMLKPIHHLNDRTNRNSSDGYCSDVIHGDFGKFWEGPARLSLIDAAEMKVINTIQIREGCPTCGEGPDSFKIPLCVLNSHAAGRKLVSIDVGRQNLDLKDLTGEGLKTGFSLLIFEAFGIAATGVFGYESKLDHVTQYSIQIVSAEKSLTTLWTEQVFAREPVGPGHWNFTWQPGHGDPNTYREDVRFDRARRLFVQRTTRVSKADAL
jgi:hypothetical protein